MKNFDSINQSDIYGILPIVYAALLDNYVMVENLLKNKYLYIKSYKKIPLNIREKFKPLVDKVSDLRNQASNKDVKRKISIRIDQIKRDFQLT